ncbi:ArsR/SmtB family transcription factor [Promicromonospora iranensis]|uniref:ArsR family transcriptional regulator n=1 Tax=Promicromonospora iranensis TaxID=1105144 RepID=A0ABU2CIH3_9MICO|nr:metalloregulator ArsR/SmtB family transcription factor [Promicromonospora iranensis]MDR7381125.1 ArsR family transcriptional regulator [Promicromonospora iranensis]
MSEWVARDSGQRGAVEQEPHPALRSTLSRGQAEDTAAVLRVVSDPTRLQILSLIHHSDERRIRVVDLTRALGLRQPTVSYHLKVMNEAGIVSRDPVGREAWYAIVPQRLGMIADLLR